MKASSDSFDPLPGLVKVAFLLLAAIGCLQGGESLHGQRAEPEQLPPETTRIYIAPDDHTDYMWSADEETYRRVFLEMIDYYLEAADATQDLPSHLHSRWNCDGSFWMWTYEKHRTPEQFARLIERIKDGHFSVPLTALVSCYGGIPVEAVIRGLYYAGRIERRHGLRFPMAVAMENQTLPYGLGSIWAGSGARYSWRGICDCATRLSSAGDREHEVYWWKGADGSRILMKWNSIYGPYGSLKYGSEGLGGYAEARYPEDVVDFVSSDQWFKERYPYPIVGAFGQGWDDLKTTDQSFVEAARKKTRPGTQVIVSNEEDFFEDFERSFGEQLPHVAASFGNEWDLYCASMAEVSASVKRSIEKLRAAEALSTIVSISDPSFLAGQKADRDLAFMNLGIYWEHDWTADGPVPREERAAWQRRVANQIGDYVDRLYAEALQTLGGMVQSGGTHPRFVVFNPLGWTRTDAADLPYASDASIHVVDLTSGQETPFQIIDNGKQRSVRILARNVPAVGYKVFEICPGAGASFDVAANVDGKTLENEFCRLTVGERGVITSWVDKQLGNREWVRTEDGSAVNELTSESPRSQQNGSISIESSGPVTVTLRIDARSPLPHTTRITLLRESPRIAIENEIQQNFDEVLTWGFPLSMSEPVLHHEECGAVLRARLLADDGHYSPRNARYDWLTLNHFADLGGKEGGVILSNADCYFMRLGKSDVDRLDTVTPSIAVLAGGQVDGPKLGIPRQGGDTFFRQRFALISRKAYDPATAMRFALEHQNPLIATAVGRDPAGSDSGLPATEYSFLQISDPNVLLWALKAADEGAEKGTIARVWNLAEQPVSFELMVEGGLKEARRVTHIETDLNSVDLVNGHLPVRAAANQLSTYRLFLNSARQ